MERLAEGAGSSSLARGRRIRDRLAITFLSLCVPMPQLGDEGRRTQRGNDDDAYCHDDETTWFDRSLTERHAVEVPG